MNRSLSLAIAFLLLIPALLAYSCPPLPPVELDELELPGLEGPVRVTTDTRGVPHVVAQSLLDGFRVQGYLHARDRFFQMDVLRRRAAGRLAELTGGLDLLADIRSRPLGLRAAAEREAALLSPYEQELLQAYAGGVNAWLASNPLPAEYTELEISTVLPWEGLDTLILAKEMSAWDNADYEGDNTKLLESYEAAGDQAGFDGRALFFQDVMRVAPMVPAATVPDAGGGTPFAASPSSGRVPRPAVAARGGRSELPTIARAREFARVSPRQGVSPHRGGPAGSNLWGLAAWASAEGVPMVANDSHHYLTAPAYSHEIHLVVEGDPIFGDLNLSGMSAPGAPGVRFGQSQFLAWGGNSFFADVWDVFRDRLVRGDPSCPARLCIESAGEMHPVEKRSETYRVNNLGNGVQDDSTDYTWSVAAWAPEAVNVLSVPFRSFGPILEVADRSVVDDPDSSPAETTALTVQYTDLHGTGIVRAVARGHDRAGRRGVWRSGAVLRGE